MSRHIAVYADWDGLDAPLRLGWLHAHPAGAREVFEFEFDAGVLEHPHLLGVSLDPRLGPYAGRQFPAAAAANFGLFLDASPDRWGRRLMERRLERAKRKKEVPKHARLVESDYLLGVHDTYRVGALRLRLDEAGNFLDDRADAAAPPFVRLREMEQASRALEEESDDSPRIDDWLRILLAPGGSLGGARPKASVVDPAGALWIAKFPSTDDDVDVGAWEMVVHALAQRCGVSVPKAQVQKFYSRHHTFMVRRFDRTERGRRLHFASGMTLTGHKDGEDASAGVSYLELAGVLMKQGVEPETDLQQLWLRIVFNMLVSNTDDHLRNHGFLLVPGKGWRLSAAFDMNPVAHGAGLRLNVSEHDNAQDLVLAQEVAPLFRVKPAAAKAQIARTRRLVSQWRTLAAALGLDRDEQNTMAEAFRLAER